MVGRGGVGDRGIVHEPASDVGVEGIRYGVEEVLM